MDYLPFGYWPVPIYYVVCYIVLICIAGVLEGGQGISWVYSVVLHSLWIAMAAGQDSAY